MQAAPQLKSEKQSSSRPQRNRWSDEHSSSSIDILASANESPLPHELWLQTVSQFLHHDQPVEGCIYVFGGRCSKVLESQHYLNSVEMLDPFRNEWITLPPMDTSRVGAAAVEVNGKLFVLGGYKTHPDDPLASMECFNPLTGKWTELAPMSKPRFGHAMASVGNRYIYVMGGDCRRVLVTDVERYDLLTNSWSIVGSLPAPVAGGRMLERNGKLFLIGGDVGTQPLSFTDKIRIFDPETNKWELNDCPLSTGRSACAVTWATDKETNEDQIVVFGGYAADADNFFELSSGEAVPVSLNNDNTTNENGNKTERRSVPGLNEPRAGCRAVTLGNKIYIIGGESPAAPVANANDSFSVSLSNSSSPLLTATSTAAPPAAAVTPLLEDDLTTGSDDGFNSSTTNAALQFLSALDSSAFPFLNDLIILDENGDGTENGSSSTAANIIQALRARLGAMSNSSSSTPPPAVQSTSAINNNNNTQSSVTGNDRKLHAEVAVFDCDTWSWAPANSIPPMTVARTAAAVCVGKGYPRSYNGKNKIREISSLRWATEDFKDIDELMSNENNIFNSTPERPARRLIAASG